MNYSQFLAEESFAIYLFHGVIAASTSRVRNYTRKHLLLDEFAAIIKTLTEGGTPISMDDVLSFQDTRETPPSRAFAVTFDDGFENNLTVAASVLADFNIPATFYVSTDFIERNIMSWTDRIEWAFEEASAIRITLPWDTETRTTRNDSEKRALLDDIRAHVKNDLTIDPQHLASDLQRQIGFPETCSQGGPLDQKMTWKQVQELKDRSDNIIGGHSHTHAVLSALDETTLNHEIGTSLKLLRDNIDIDPIHYSYPEGLDHCFNDTVISSLKREGIRCSPTAIFGVNSWREDPFHLKRITVV